MSNWFEISGDIQNAIDPGEEVKSARDVRVHVYMSPYDVPQHVRGGYNDKDHRFQIEFKYIDDEPYDLEQAGEHVYFRLGRNSRRIYGIELDVEALRAKTVNIEMHASRIIDTSFEAFLGHERQSKRAANYNAARMVVNRTGKKIFSALEGSQFSAPSDCLPDLT